MHCHIVALDFEQNYVKNEAQKYCGKENNVEVQIIGQIFCSKASVGQTLQNSRSSGEILLRIHNKIVLVRRRVKGLQTKDTGLETCADDGKLSVSIPKRALKIIQSANIFTN
jgi:hypothetical protein